MGKKTQRRKIWKVGRLSHVLSNIPFIISFVLLSHQQRKKIRNVWKKTFNVKLKGKMMDLQTGDSSFWKHINWLQHLITTIKI